MAVEAVGGSSTAGFEVEVSWKTAAGADRTRALFLLESFFVLKAVGAMSGAAFNFEVVFGTATGEGETRAIGFNAGEV